jgi:antitoxin component of MazEF toxin-antitoxin module
MAQIIGEWGGSAAIRIPVGVLKKMNLKKGDAVEIDYRDGKAIITPAEASKIIHARDLFAGWRGKQSVDAAWLDGASRGTEKW